MLFRRACGDPFKANSAHGCHSDLTVAFTCVGGHRDRRHSYHISRAICRSEGCAPGFIVDTHRIVGKIASKTILPNRLIYPEAIRSPAIIQKGAATSLTYRSGGLTISVKATALAEAAIGESVSVRSQLNGSVVTGTAQADGTVLAGGS